MRRDDPASPRPDRPGASTGLIVLLTALVMVGQMSISVYAPSMPAITAAFAADAAGVKLTMSVFLFGFGFAQLVHGPLSDRFGRRPVLLGGLIAYLAGTLACAAAPSLTALILGRLLQAIGACACSVVGRAIVRDRFERGDAARVLGLVGMVMAVGPALGPMIGGKLQVWLGWRAGFVFLLILGLALLVAAAARFRESLARPNPAATELGPLLRNYGTLLSSRRYLPYALIVGFCFCGLFAYMTGAPFVLIDLVGLPPDLFGMLFVFTVGGYIAGNGLATWRSARIGHDRMIGLGAAAAAAAGVLMLVTVLTGPPTVVKIVGAMSLFMFGFGLVIPNAMSGALMPFPAIAGVASAGIGFLQMGLGGLGSFAVGHFFDETAVPMAAVIAASALGCLACSLAIGRQPLPA